jgi:hypothetical protein
LTPIVILDEPAVQRLLRYQELIPAIARALADLSAGRVVQPVLPVAPNQGFFGVMPAYAGALGAKLVTFYPRNESIHTHHAVIRFFRPGRGPTISGRSMSPTARRIASRPTRGSTSTRSSLLTGGASPTRRTGTEIPALGDERRRIEPAPALHRRRRRPFHALVGGRQQRHLPRRTPGGSRSCRWTSRPAP